MKRFLNQTLTYIAIPLVNSSKAWQYRVIATRASASNVNSTPYRTFGFPPSSTGASVSSLYLVVKQKKQNSSFLKWPFSKWHNFENEAMSKLTTTTKNHSCTTLMKACQYQTKGRPKQVQWIDVKLSSISQDSWPWITWQWKPLRKINEERLVWRLLAVEYGGVFPHLTKRRESFLILTRLLRVFTGSWGAGVTYGN